MRKLHFYCLALLIFFLLLKLYVFSFENLIPYSYFADLMSIFIMVIILIPASALLADYILKSIK